MYLIVGLGNPEKKYLTTRHNIGFITIDYLIDELGIKLDKEKFDGIFTQTNLFGQKVIFAKPLTYMNNSGICIRQLVDFYKLQPQDVCIIYDDIDLPVGEIRVKTQGSAGTHNGVKSVVSHLNSTSFNRVRIGVGKPEEIPLINYVTQNFPEDQMPIMRKAVIKAAKAVESFIKDGAEQTMNKYNRKGEN